MRWTRAEIEQHLYKGARVFQRETALYFAVEIEAVLSHRRLHGVIDFKGIINGKFWEKINHLDLCRVFDDFLQETMTDFRKGIFSNDYKFPKAKSREISDPKTVAALEDEKLYSAGVLARIIKKPKKTIQRWVDAGLFKHREQGSERIWLKAEFDDMGNALGIRGKEFKLFIKKTSRNKN